MNIQEQIDSLQSMSKARPENSLWPAVHLQNAADTLKKLNRVYEAAKYLEAEVRYRADEGTFSVEMEDAARALCITFAALEE